MNIDEFKKIYPHYFIPRYTHFDRKIRLEDVFDYIKNENNIKFHKFYPFISYSKEYVRYNNSKGKNIKRRELCYAAHIDSLIYKYYGILLNNKYSEFLDKNILSDVPIAYRSDLKGKSNIQFAKIAFDYLKKQEQAYVFIGDFKDFFPSLNHEYLKEQICQILDVSKLSDDYYAVFKNITRYSTVPLDELLTLNNLKNNKNGINAFNQLKVALPNNSKMNELKHKGIINIKRNSKLGIPQGSPMSGVLANIYMIKFDLAIKNIVDAYSGIYMRYSDDIIIIVPVSKKELFNKVYSSIIVKINNIPNLILEDKKKNIFYYNNGILINISDKYMLNKENCSNIIDYLGFSFDGKYVSIRAKTLTKYYYRAYKK